MINLRYGDMLWMQNTEYGETLYMVVNSPIICEHCGKRIIDWELNEERKFFCPKCKEEIVEFSKERCVCGEIDQASLVVASNNNFCCNTDGETIPYNHMVNRIFPFCEKSIIDEVKQGKIRLLSKQEANQRKRLLVWTAQNTYEPGKPMPQWIIDQFPDE